MTKIILVLGIHVYLYNLFMILSSKALIGENVRYAIDGELTFVVSIGCKRPNTTGPYSHVCTGALVSNRDILSAEHCVKYVPKEDVKLFIGNKDLNLATKYDPDWWISYDAWVVRHKLPRPFTKNDLVMIRLTKNVTNAIEPGILSTIRNRHLITCEVAIAGWGRKDDNSRAQILQIGSLMVLEMETCKHKITRKNRTRYNLENNFFCTSVEPYLLANIGDSGGPILYYNEIVGITKSVYPYPGVPTEQVNIHTGIFTYRNFIFDVIHNA